MADINLGVGAANSASDAYEIANSLKFEADNSEGLTFTPSSTTNNKVWTFSAWIKRTELGVTNHTVFGHYTDGDNHSIIRFDGGDKLDVRNTVSTTAYQLDTDMVFRDTSAWYHIVVAFDTTQSTAANRTKVYVNGSQVDLSGTYTAQNVVTYINTASKVESIGVINSTEYNSGYMAEINFVDGSQLAATSFGEYDNNSGIWIPKEYTGSHGSNGFYLDFEDSSSLGADDSGNGNNFTLSNISSADQATDSPTNNFNTFTPLYKYASQATISEGGTSIGYPGAAWRGAKGSIGVINGKWYWEVKSTGSWSNLMLGIQSSNVSTNLNSGNSINHNNSIYIGYGSGNYYYYTGGSQTGNESTGWNSGGDWGSSDIFGFALDLDSATKKFILYRNGSAVNGSGTNLPSAFQDEYLSPFAAGYDASEQHWNFGGYTQMSISSSASDANGYGNFEYAPPSGYYALCTKNIAEYG